MTRSAILTRAYGSAAATPHRILAVSSGILIRESLAPATGSPRTGHARADKSVGHLLFERSPLLVRRNGVAGQCHYIDVRWGCRDSKPAVSCLPKYHALQSPADLGPGLARPVADVRAIHEPSFAVLRLDQQPIRRVADDRTMNDVVPAPRRRVHL